MVNLHIAPDELRELFVKRLDVLSELEFEQCRRSAARLRMPLERALLDRTGMPVTFLLKQIAETWHVGFIDVGMSDIQIAPVVDAIRADDDHATQIWLKSIRALAAGLVSVINIIDPALIVIGGGISQSGEKLFAPLRDELDRLEWRPPGQCIPIVPALLGEWAGAYGAAKFAMT